MEDNPLPDLLRALAIADVPLRKMSIGTVLGEFDKMSILPPDAFALRRITEVLPRAGQLFSGLTHLLLRLRPSHYPGELVEVMPDISFLLSATLRLQLLVIEYDDIVEASEIWDWGWYWGSGQYVEMNTFGALVGNIALPYLETLTLVGIDGTERDFQRFLRASPRLKHLSLSDVYLYSGLWKRTINDMRKFLKLESISFGGWRDEKSEHLCFDPGCREKLNAKVSDFFFKDGPNPFDDD